MSYDLKLSAVVDGETAVSLHGVRAQDAFGISVGSAWDINGDGVADLWVSAVGYKVGEITLTVRISVVQTDPPDPR